MSFELTPTEIRAIEKGACKLERTEDPDCEKGERIVALWGPKRWGGIPWKLRSEELIAITVRQIHKPKEGVRGNWQIRFDVEDRRPAKDMYLAKTVDHGDYTTNADPNRLSDDLAIPDPEETRRQEMKKRLKLAEETTKAERGASELSRVNARMQEKRAKQALHETLDGLDSAGQQLLLTQIMRDIRAAANNETENAA